MFVKYRSLRVLLRQLAQMASYHSDSVLSSNDGSSLQMYLEWELAKIWLLLYGGMMHTSVW